jgi:hypothetical protein
MNDAQLYLAIGVPVFAVLMGFMGSVLQVNTINARITSLEAAFNSRITGFENSVNSRFSSLESRFETLIGKVIEIDTRLTRVEERLERR